ncbi:MAG: branched-chain amino acid ABC transporter permease [Aeromicrobium sp.]
MQALWGAIVTGTLYGLVGVGFVLIFRASKVLSFAQGAFMLLGAFIFYQLVKFNGLPFVPAVLLTALIVAAFSGLVYLVVFSRVAARQPFATSIATIGLAGVLQAIVAVQFGTTPLALPPVVPSRSFTVAGATITVEDLVSVALVVIALAIILLLMRTRLGLQMNAVADSASLSVHLGVSAARVATIAWALAGLAAALAGIAFALRSSVDPVGVAAIGFFAFPAIILGGLDSIPGALVGGLILGALQNGVAVWLGAGWVDLISFSLMLVFLLFKPTGLFGKAEVVRL